MFVFFRCSLAVANLPVSVVLKHLAARVLVAPVSIACQTTTQQRSSLQWWRAIDGLTYTLTYTHQFHTSQLHIDMVPFVCAVLLTGRVWQNRSGIEQGRRRNLYAWSPTLCCNGGYQQDSHSASSSSPNTKRPVLLSYLVFALISFSPIVFFHACLCALEVPGSLNPTFSCSALTEASELFTMSNAAL